MSSSSDSEVNFCCPICLVKYNTDDVIPIVAPRCAHTICQPCALQRDSAVCVVCNVISLYADGVHCPSSDWYKNFALIDCLQEMEKMKAEADEKAEQQKLKMELELAEQREQTRIEMEQKLADLKSEYDNAIDYMSCGQCGVREKRERMKICCSCAGIEEIDSTEKDMEAEVLSVSICAFCFTERHLGHNVINYLTFKVHNTLSLTSSDGIEMVNSMDEMCVQEAKNGAEQIVAWKETMNGFREQHRTDVTYRDCLSINDSLKKEAEIVCNASEDTLPSLRMLTQIVKESHERISTLLSGIAERESDEDAEQADESGKEEESEKADKSEKANETEQTEERDEKQGEEEERKPTEERQEGDEESEQTEEQEKREEDKKEEEEKAKESDEGEERDDGEMEKDGDRERHQTEEGDEAEMKKEGREESEQSYAREKTDESEKAEEKEPTDESEKTDEDEWEQTVEFDEESNERCTRGLCC